MPIDRAELIARMREFAKKGLSFNKFYEMRAKFGFTIRRSEMLAEWHDIAEYVRKTGVVKGIKAGYVPEDKIAEMRNWEFKGLDEYMYVAEVWAITRKGQPPTQKFVSLMSVEPLMIEQVELGIIDRWYSEWKCPHDPIVTISIESVYHAPKK
jgi:hypothetical protein